jgi:IclR family KDG regulon transcriptional repressor
MVNKAKSSVIRVVSLALDSIELLCKQTGGLGVRELARELGVGKSTGHRILQTLEEHGLTRQDPETKRYAITARLVNMASLIQSNMEFRSVARPLLAALQKRYGETIFIGVLDTAEVVIVDRIDSSEPLRMTQDIGYREPAHSTALGKVLLASLTEAELSSFSRAAKLKAFTGKTLTSLDSLKSELKRVRLLGFALDDEETLTGVRCVAAPIRDALGRVLAAVSLSGPSVRLLPEKISDVAQDVRSTAESISRDLGFKGRGAIFDEAEKKTVLARSATANQLESGRAQTSRLSTLTKRRVRRRARKDSTDAAVHRTSDSNDPI